MSAETKAEADRRVRQALAHIQHAQEEIGCASSRIASIDGMSKDWERLEKLYEKLRAEWHKLDASRQRGKFDLDSMATETLRKAGKLP